MPKKLLLSNVGGEPSGFILAAVFAAAALVAAIFVAVDLPKMQSFGEIAAPSFFAIVFGALGAYAAVITARVSEDEDESSRF